MTNYLIILFLVVMFGGLLYLYRSIEHHEADKIIEEFERDYEEKNLRN